MISEQQRWTMDYHAATTGIPLTEAGVEAAGKVLLAAQMRLSPAARAALRRGPAACKAFLTDLDDQASEP